MLSKRSVVLDVEGFRYNKNAFVVKELQITTSDYIERLIFFTSSEIQYTTKARTKTYNWLTNYFHGLHWEKCDFLYINLNQILQTFVLRTGTRTERLKT